MKTRILYLARYAPCVAIALALFLGGSPALVSRAQDLDLPTVVGSTQLAEQANRLIVSGGYAYVAEGWPRFGRFEIVSVHDPANPQISSGLDLEHSGEELAISGNYAYVCGTVSEAPQERGRLDVIDTSNPANPQRVGRYEMNKMPDGVAIVGGYAYLTSSFSDEGLEVVDIANPTSPQRVNGLAIRGWWLGIAASGDRLYLGESGTNTQLHVFDISDPRSPALAATYDASDWQFGLPMSPDFTFQPDPDETWMIFDASDPTNPRKVGGYKTIASALNTEVSGNRALVNRRGVGFSFQVIDISDPKRPRRVGGYGLNDYPSAVTVSGRYGYLTSTWWDATYQPHARLRVMDLMPLPANPQRTVTFQEGEGSFGRVAVSGGYAYASANGYRVRTAPTDRDPSLRVIDISNPANPRQVGKYEIAPDAEVIVWVEVAVSGDYLYMVEESHVGGIGQGRFHAIDVRDPTNSRRVGVLDLAGNLRGHTLEVAGNHAYMVTSRSVDLGGGTYRELSSLLTVDISDPANPRILGSYDPPSANLHNLRISVLAAATNIAYLVTSRMPPNAPSLETHRFEAVDLADPGNPRPLGGVDLARIETRDGFSDFTFADVTLSGNLAFVLRSRVTEISIDWPVLEPAEVLTIIDISDSANPRRVGGYRTLDNWLMHSVSVSGGFAYLADEVGGLHVIDISNPANPMRVGGNSAFSAYDVKVHGDRVFVAGGTDGLIILNKYTDLRIGPAIVLDDGRLQLQLRGVSGQRVRVQRSINLKDWADWQTVTLGETGCQLTDTIVANSQCFYRAVEDKSIITNKP